MPAPVTTTVAIRDSARIISSRRRTPEGFLVARAALTRTGAFQYSEQAGDELTGVLYRTPETVFHDETINSARIAGVTFGHQPVDADNWREATVGNVTGEPTRAELQSGDTALEADIVIRDPATIGAIERGMSELSIGYRMQTVPSADERFDYETLGPLRINHVAIVERGRAGREVKIYDEETQMPAPVLENQRALDERVAEEARAQIQRVREQGRIDERRRAAIYNRLYPYMDEGKRASLRDASPREIYEAIVVDEIPSEEIATMDPHSLLLHGVAIGLENANRESGAGDRSRQGMRSFDPGGGFADFTPASDAERAFLQSVAEYQLHPREYRAMMNQEFGGIDPHAAAAHEYAFPVSPSNGANGVSELSTPATS